MERARQVKPAFAGGVRRIASIAAAVATLVALVLFAAAAASPHAALAANGSGGASASVVKNGLVEENGNLRWYKKGVLQKSVKKKLKGATYYFNKKGNAVRGKGVKVGKAYWVFGDDGKLLAPAKNKYYRLKSGLYYVNAKGHPAKTGFAVSKERLRYFGKNGRVKTGGTRQGIRFKADGWVKRDLASKLKMTVMKRIAKICDESWSRSRKLQACWNWINHLGTYVNSSAVRDTQNEKWVQRQAYKTMNGSLRECYGVACSFAMMAFELGYDPTIHLKPGSHAWVTIGGKRYDSVQPFMTHPPRLSGVKTIKVVSYAETNPKGKSTRSKIAGVKVPEGGKGWAQKDGSWYYFEDGWMLKSRWVTLKGKRYYLLKSGKAATGSVKVKVSNGSSRKAYFVFSSKRGTLQTGGKTRVVSVGGVKYRVSAKGRAVSGWGPGKRAYYLKDGSRATGAVMVNGKVCAFSAKGAYKASRTKKLRAALKMGVDAKKARKLLGKPKRTLKENSCRESFESVDGTVPGMGTERMLVYAHLKVSTYTPPDGSAEYIAYVE